MTRYSNKLSLSEKDLEKSQLEVRNLESQLKDMTNKLLAFQDNQPSDSAKLETVRLQGQIEALKSDLSQKDQKITALLKETDEL